MIRLILGCGECGHPHADGDWSFHFSCLECGASLEGADIVPHEIVPGDDDDSVKLYKSAYVIYSTAVQAIGISSAWGSEPSRRRLKELVERASAALKDIASLARSK